MLVAITFSGKTNEHFVIRLSVKPLNASKIRGSPPDSLENNSIVLLLNFSLPPFSFNVLRNFFCHSLDNLMGTLTEDLAGFGPEADGTSVSAAQALAPYFPIVFCEMPDRFEDLGLTIFSSNTNANRKYRYSRML